MRVTVVSALVIIAIGAFALTSDASHLRCHTGNAQGFVAVRSDPPHLVGTIPSRFTSEPAYFDTRYNCTGGSAQVRRVDQGIYDVRLPGLAARLVLTDAISTEGVSSSAEPLGDGIVRVSLRGPLGGNDIASRRDVPFVVVVY